MTIWVVALVVFQAWASASISACDVTAQTESGTVCGRIRSAANGDLYASFRGIPYAKAPYDELRFAEPQKPEPFEGIFDATETGPICPQVDVIYGTALQPRAMDEDCLRINVHVPLHSLPDPEIPEKPLLPVFVFIHGGSFSYGSGDTDLHGPEYLMAGKGVIFVTFNYRLNVFGFLSLYSKEIPGNAGLRDALFALKWVQNNIRHFGGDPAQVTLGGQSAGGSIAHLLSISPAVKDQNLFKRIIALSGNAISGFFSCSSTYTQPLTTLFLLAAGINIFQTSAGIHRQLVKAPLENLLRANKVLLDISGLVSLTPVIENAEEGFTTILPTDPEILVSEGYGKEFTAWFGFTSNETQVFKPRLEEVNIVRTFRAVPPLTLPQNIFFGSNFLTVPIITGMMLNEYYDSMLITLDKFLVAGNDQFYLYPTMRLVEKRLNVGAEPTYVSQFGYHGEFDVFKRAQNRDWPGSGHAEDLFYIFRANSILGEGRNELTGDNDDSKMRQWMTELLAEYIKTGSPVPQSENTKWPPTEKHFWFQNISVPHNLDFRPATPYMEEKKIFFDKMNRIARGL